MDDYKARPSQADAARAAQRLEQAEAEVQPRFPLSDTLQPRSTAHT